MDKKYIVGLVVVAIIAISGVFFPNVTNTVIEKTLGGSAGPRHTEHQEFTQNFKRGGTAVATTSQAITTHTLTAAELRETTSYISWDVGANITLTTMASTSAPFVGLRAGEAIEVFFYNATTSTGTTATFAAGTGVDLQEDEGGTVIVNGLEVSKLTFLKKANSDILFIVEPYQVGD